MIKEEYKRLLSLVESCQDAEKVTLEDILKEAVVFFETLRKEFPKASKEDREEMIQMMTHLHARLQEVSRETAEASGMTEDELSSFAENPSNFTPEQWQVVQSSRRQLYDSARKFSSSLSKPEDADSKAPKKKPIRSKARRTKRKDWMQS
ncbi:MAG: hypothetical protein P0S96_01935 [Simkaniaceae bacterium]|nr:hypothetical protein [Candidatus Sacchlamyda saccharinae]